MAQVNLTLNQEEILQLLSSGDSSLAFKELLTKSLNQFLAVESASQLKAEPYERNEERQDQRNGVRERPLTTRIGTITLQVPRHRNQPFHTMLFENYQRSESALITTMVEMVIEGVSTRKVAKVMEELCGKEFSKSTVSEACKQLDVYVEAFRNRLIEPGRYPFLIADATYFKVREDHRVVSKAFMIAIGITASGEREVIGFDVYDDECNSTWISFIQSLKHRGLSDVMMYTSDAHPSIRRAMGMEFPNAVWQRCQFHFIRNILDAAPKAYKAGLETEIRETFNCETITDARKRCREVLDDYADVAEKSMEILENGFEDAMTIMMLPKEMQRPLRTSNLVERLNGELKRRSDVIKVFPNAASVLRLMGSVTIEYHEALLNKNKLFYQTSLAKISAQTREILAELAHEQFKRAQAA